MPVVFCTLLSAGFPLAAGHLRPTSSFPPLLATGDTAKGVPCVCGGLACLLLLLQLPLPISCSCQLARKHHWQGLPRAAPGCMAAEGGGVPLTGDTFCTPSDLKASDKPREASTQSTGISPELRPVIHHMAPLYPNHSNAVEVFSILPPSIASNHLCPQTSRSLLSACNSPCPAV